MTARRSKGARAGRTSYSRSRSGPPKPRQLKRAGVRTVFYDGIKKENKQ